MSIANIIQDPKMAAADFDHRLQPDGSGQRMVA